MIYVFYRSPTSFVCLIVYHIAFPNRVYLIYVTQYLCLIVCLICVINMGV